MEHILRERISGKVDYVNCLTYPDLQPLINENDSVILAVAVYYENARLIDNLILDQSGEEIYRSDKK